MELIMPPLRGCWYPVFGAGYNHNTPSGLLYPVLVLAIIITPFQGYIAVFSSLLRIFAKAVVHICNPAYTDRFIIVTFSRCESKSFKTTQAQSCCCKAGIVITSPQPLSTSGEGQDR